MLLGRFVGKSRTGAAAVLPCTMPLLLRVFCEARNEDGATPAAARATERFATTSQLTAYLTGLPLVAACLLLVITFVAHGDDDALPLFPGLTNMFVGIAVATVVGTVFVVHFSRRARLAGAGGGDAPTPATVTRHFGKLALAMATSLAVVAFALAPCLLATTSAPPEREPDGAAYTCSA
uniref:Uncharacterized protein n=1 Tax=Arundo donax TaxID=35708 RepID=A0A0A9BQM0_ARUDO